METVRKVAGQIQSGQVHLNYPDWDPNAPFGGYKRSGNGREYGLEGMDEYLETKAVLGFGIPIVELTESATWHDIGVGQSYEGRMARYLLALVAQDIPEPCNVSINRFAW